MKLRSRMDCATSELKNSISYCGFTWRKMANHKLFVQILCPPAVVSVLLGSVVLFTVFPIIIGPALST